MPIAHGSRQRLASTVVAFAAGSGVVAFVCWRSAVRRMTVVGAIDLSSQSSHEQERDLSCQRLPSLIALVVDHCDLAHVLDRVPIIMEYLDMMELWRARTLGIAFAGMSSRYINVIRMRREAMAHVQRTMDHSGDAFRSMFAVVDAIRGESDVRNVAAVFEFAKSEPQFLDARDCAGRSPLMRAAQAGSLRLTLALLEASANLHARGGNGWRPLHYAAVGGNVDLCRLFLDKRADVDARSSDGFSALAYAREAGRDRVVTHLLVRGADPCLLDKKEGGGGDAGVG